MSKSPCFGYGEWGAGGEYPERKTDEISLFRKNNHPFREKNQHVFSRGSELKNDSGLPSNPS